MMFAIVVMLAIESCAFGDTVTATVPESVAAAKFEFAADVAVTVMTAVPGPTAVTRPVVPTVATAGAVVP